MTIAKEIYFLSLLICILLPNSAIAQIEEDGTTLTDIVSDPSDPNRVLIDGGTRRGDNLFHSFERFQTSPSSDVVINANPDIDLVIGRVTGGERAEILGGLTVSGNADLIFLSPNGISIGARANISLGGSFLGTTASELQLDDGFLFSAVNPSLVLGSSVTSLPIRIGFEAPTSSIVVQPSDPSDSWVDLEPGNTFSLIGGILNIEGANFTLLSSNVELGAVATNSNIDIQYSEGDLSFDPDSSAIFQNITLNRTKILTLGGANLSAGNVNIFGRNILLQGGEVSTDGGSENSGDITIVASNDLRLTSELQLFSANSDFDAGDITLSAGRNLFVSQSKIFANTQATGSGGNIVLGAGNNVRITTGIIDPSSLGAGNAGELNIDARNLFVEGGSQLRSISSDIGNSGGIAISVGDSIVLSGMGDPDGTGSLQPSQISVATEATGDLEGTGNAGNIDIITSELRLLDGASISAESNTKGDAGSITITTSQDLTLDNASRIEASTLSGEGNLLFDVRDLVLLNGSRISTDASSNADGGNIKIDADNIVALDDSDIVANADNGAGGFIEINAVGVFGTDIREEETPESDITAVSRRDPELNGTVILNTPDLEPENNLEELPEDVIDAETLVSASPCPEGVESEFVVEGSGGIPSSPGNTLSPEGLIPNDLTEPVETLERDSESSAPSDNLNSDTIAQDLGVTPAWGWVWNDKGEILLTAHDPTVIASQRLPAHSGLCSGR